MYICINQFPYKILINFIHYFAFVYLGWLVLQMFFPLCIWLAAWLIMTDIFGMAQNHQPGNCANDASRLDDLCKNCGGQNVKPTAHPSQKHIDFNLVDIPDRQTDG